MPLHVELNSINQSLDAVRTELFAVREQLQALNSLKSQIGVRISKHASIIHDIKGDALSGEHISREIERLASRLAYTYASENQSNPPVLVSLMNGAMPFAHALQMALSARGFQFEFTTLTTKSYQGTTSGDLSIVGEFTHPIAARRVFILDDIADTLKTGNTIKTFLKARGAASVDLLVLIDKQDVREDPDNNPEYSVFQIDNKFVIGGGMDYLDLCRYLENGDIKAVDLTTLPNNLEMEQLNQIPVLDTRVIQLMVREEKLFRQQARCIQNQAEQAEALKTASDKTVYTPGFFGVSEVSVTPEPTADALDLSY